MLVLQFISQNPQRIFSKIISALFIKYFYQTKVPLLNYFKFLILILILIHSYSSYISLAMAAVCRYVTFSSSNKEFFIFPDKYFRALAVFAAFSKESSKFSPSI